MKFTNRGKSVPARVAGKSVGRLRLGRKRKMWPIFFYSE
jgi:hypothetical protein